MPEPKENMMKLSKQGQQILSRLTAYNPEFESRIRCGIEMNRKGALKLEIKTAAGTPVEACSIRYKLLRHEFDFGCNGFMFRQFRGDESWKNEAYEEKFKELFNLAVIPFYWNATEPERRKYRFDQGSSFIYRRPATDELLEFCEANKITAKGHPLIWHTHLPEWLPRDQNELLDEYEYRIAMIAERYCKRIHKFDVCNEGLQLDSLHYGIYPQGNVPPDHIEKAFRLAGKYFPESTELIYNEGPWMSWNNYHGTRTPLYLLAKHFRDEKLPMRGLGLQYHIAFFEKLDDLVQWSDQMLDPAHLYAHMDLYGSLGVPLNVSEITIPGMDELGDGALFQQFVAEQLYRIWFSHPAFNSIIWWNLVDGTAFGVADTINNNQGENRYLGGLLNNDMTEKPAFKALKRLIWEEWNTCGTLDYRRDDTNKLYGFYGDYDLEIDTAAGKFMVPVRISKHAPAFQNLCLPC